MKTGSTSKKGLLDSHGLDRTGSLLEQEQISQPGMDRPKPAFAVCRPDVDRVPDRLLTAIVVVVPKRWADLALELNRRRKRVAVHDDEVPLLLRPEVSGQLHRRTAADTGGRKAGIDKDRLHQFGHRIHMRAASYGSSQASVLLPQVALSLRLPLAHNPIAPHGGFEGLLVHYGD